MPLSKLSSVGCTRRGGDRGTSAPAAREGRTDTGEVQLVISGIRSDSCWIQGEAGWKARVEGKGWEA